MSDESDDSQIDDELDEIYRNLHKLQLKSLKKIQNNINLMITIEQFFNNVEEDALELWNDEGDEKDVIIKKIIFTQQCHAHKMLMQLNVNRNKNNLLKTEENKFVDLTKWQLHISLEYFMVNFKFSDNKQTLIQKMRNFLIKMKQEEDDPHIMNLKKTMHLIGDDIINLRCSLSTLIELKIDGECFGWSATQRTIIIKIFNECSFVRNAQIPTTIRNPESMFSNVPDDIPIYYVYSTWRGFAVFMETMQHGALAADLRSEVAWRIACKIRPKGGDWITLRI